METIYIAPNSTSFTLARWLLLKRKINQQEFKEYCRKNKEELIKIIYDFGFIIKERDKKAAYEPKGSQLFDDIDDELLD